MAQIMEHDTFQDQDINKRYYALLAEEPSDRCLKELEALDFKKDKWILKNKVIYILVDDKISQSKLTHTLLERVLKVKVTVRNYKTMRKMNDK